MFYSIVIVLQDLSTGWLQCDPGPLFKQETHALPGWISNWVRLVIVHYWKNYREQLSLLLKRVRRLHFVVALERNFCSTSSVACSMSWIICVYNSTFWWLLCQWFQKSFQSQGKFQYRNRQKSMAAIFDSLLHFSGLWW